MRITKQMIRKNNIVNILSKKSMNKTLLIMKRIKEKVMQVLMKFSTRRRRMNNREKDREKKIHLKTKEMLRN